MMTHHYASWTPASDTCEIPRIRRGVPLGDQPTHELHLLDLPPAVPAPAARRRIRQALARLARSTSLRGSIDAAFWPAVLSAGLLLGVQLIAATRGIDLTVTGGTYR